ncbi:calcium/sodium antiporter [Jiella sp. LLJ827]|nr:calcium/sodium antiporter [Jiella sp. LLJ827]
MLLIAGGDLLVRGAVKVAEHLGVSPLVIGLTLVGFGTSAPELVTSVQAALSGAPGIAFGNIVGSNIANILLIAGISAILFPIAVSSSALRRDAMVMVGVTLVFAVLAFLVPFGRPVGLVFVVALALYIYFAFRQESTAAEHGAAYEKARALEAVDPAVVPQSSSTGGLILPLLIAIGGLALVVLGGRFLVGGAVSIAEAFGVPETVIGLTIVAIGTSMPELVTSIVAAFKRQSDVAFGNIVGSNIYNLLGIAGVTALISPTRVPAEIATFDNLLMVAVTLLFMLFSTTGLRIGRREGGVLLAGYLAYLYVLWP